MINRSLSPEFKDISSINFIHPEQKKLDNGIPLFVISANEQNLLRIEFVFNNVNWDVSKPLQAIATNSLLTNGTALLSAQQIAEKVDYYGAFLQTDYSADHITVSLYTLHKYLNNVLPIVKSVITESTFPEDELSIFIR
ncbi:MAG: insulinase family protein, partial [Sphingobacteriaceae bacterium]|nr:insulinase family protein [Sphingobacteriaceae bacterium]